jgi:hypothetical protein
MQHTAAIFQGVRFTVEFSNKYLRLIVGGCKGSRGTRLWRSSFIKGLSQVTSVAVACGPV